MPKKASSKSEKSKQNEICLLFDFSEQKVKTKKDEIKKREGPQNPKEIPMKKQAKMLEQREEFSGDEENEMIQPSMVKNLSSGWKKTLAIKCKKVEGFIEQCSAAREKTEKCFEAQAKEQHNLNEEYGKQLGLVIKQWENDIKQAKETEDNINNLLSQEQKTLTQIRDAQTKWFDSLKSLHAYYVNSCKENSDQCNKSYETAKDEMKKNLKIEEKKFLSETKNQEISNFRKSMEAMIFN